MFGVLDAGDGIEHVLHLKKWDIQDIGSNARLEKSRVGKKLHLKDGTGLAWAISVTIFTSLLVSCTRNGRPFSWGGSCSELSSNYKLLEKLDRAIDSLENSGAREDPDGRFELEKLIREKKRLLVENDRESENCKPMLKSPSQERDRGY